MTMITAVCSALQSRLERESHGRPCKVRLSAILVRDDGTETHLTTGDDKIRSGLQGFHAGERTKVRA